MRFGHQARETELKRSLLSSVSTLLDRQPVNPMGCTTMQKTTSSSVSNSQRFLHKTGKVIPFLIAFWGLRPLIGNLSPQIPGQCSVCGKEVKVTNQAQHTPRDGEDYLSVLKQGWYKKWSNISYNCKKPCPIRALCKWIRRAEMTLTLESTL